MKVDYAAIGRRIREERKKKKLSQEQLSEKADLSPVHLSHIETANTKLSLPVLISLANALDVSSDTLLCDSIKASDKAYTNSILYELDDCTNKELKLLSDSVKAIKAAYRNIHDQHNFS